MEAGEVVLAVGKKGLFTGSSEGDLVGVLCLSHPAVAVVVSYPCRLNKW